MVSTSDFARCSNVVRGCHKALREGMFVASIGHQYELTDDSTCTLGLANVYSCEILATLGRKEYCQRECRSNQ